MENLREINRDGGSPKLFTRLDSDKKPPKKIFALGEFDDELFERPSVAIVGSRKATDYGREVTLKFARELAERGVVVVSGLAIGVDSFAAQGGLAGGGTTIAVLGNSLPAIYPAQNREIAAEILAGQGAIFSEYEPGTPTFPNNFLARNRLISALADIVIVVEGNLKSGSLNTAKHAREQGKILMAVPGNITSPLSSGPNDLLARGAFPAISSAGVIRKLREKYPDFVFDAKKNPARKSAKKSPENPATRAMLEILAQNPATTDELAAATKLPAETLLATLTMLELGAEIKNLGGKWTKI